MSVRKSAAPQDRLNMHKADEVLEAAVKLVRVHQRQRRSGDVPPEELAEREAQLQSHFPSISKADAYRLANVLVDVGSLALRQALGLKVVLPESREVPPMPVVPSTKKVLPSLRYEEGKSPRVILPGSVDVMVVPALAVLFGNERKTVADITSELEARGWQYVSPSRNPQGALLGLLKGSALFRRVSGLGSASAIFRYVGLPVTEECLSLDFSWNAAHSRRDRVEALEVLSPPSAPCRRPR